MKRQQDKLKAGSPKRKRVKGQQGGGGRRAHVHEATDSYEVGHRHIEA